jgi:hypothetical protein
MLLPFRKIAPTLILRLHGISRGAHTLDKELDRAQS